jgi:hypothetical protein
LDTREQLRIVISLPENVRNEVFSLKYLKDKKAIGLYYELLETISPLEETEIYKRSNILKPKLLRRANAQVIFNNRIKDLYDKTPANL